MRQTLRPNAIAPKRDRLAKRMAAAGVCSRREAERWIEAGRVMVNNERIITPATTVGLDDVITVDGRPLARPDSPRLFKLHKPRGYVTTTQDPQGRKTVFSLVPAGLPRVVSVGRLDINTEGLLLFTNSPALADALMRPATGLPRTYRVRIDGNMDASQLATLAKGPTVDGVRYRPVEVLVEPGDKKGRNSWVQLTLTEGKNREIRNLMSFLGLNVSRLIRTSYGPITLGKLPRLAFSEVPGHAVKKLIEENKIKV